MTKWQSTLNDPLKRNIQSFIKPTIRARFHLETELFTVINRPRLLKKVNVSSAAVWDHVTHANRLLIGSEIMAAPFVCWLVLFLWLVDGRCQVLSIFVICVFMDYRLWSVSQGERLWEWDNLGIWTQRVYLFIYLFINRLSLVHFLLPTPTSLECWLHSISLLHSFCLYHINFHIHHNKRLATKNKKGKEMKKIKAERNGIFQKKKRRK